MSWQCPWQKVVHTSLVSIFVTVFYQTHIRTLLGRNFYIFQCTDHCRNVKPNQSRQSSLFVSHNALAFVLSLMNNGNFPFSFISS